MKYQDTVAFLPRHETSWQKMKELASVIASTSEFKPLIVLACASVYPIEAEARSLGFRTSIVRTIPKDPMLATTRLERWVSTTERGAHSLWGSVPKAVRVARKLTREYATLQSLLQRERPIAVLVPGDRELWPVPSMLRAAKDCGIPSIIATSNIPTTEPLARLRAKSHRFRVERQYRPPLLNYLAAWLYPEQVHNTVAGPMLFSPGWLTLTLGALRMLSENPWAQGGGNSTYLLVDGERKRSIAERFGVGRSKILVVGDITHDPLYSSYLSRESIRQRLTQKYPLNERTLVVCAMPIFAEHNLTDWDTHLRQLDTHFARTIDMPLDLLVSLHPKSSRASYEALCARYQLTIASESLQTLLPAADIFICGGSSTAVWAALCGVPCVNIDFIGIASSDFPPSLGTFMTKDAQSFDDALSRLIADPAARTAAAKAQASAGKEVAIFDGKSGDRVIALLRKLAADRAAIHR
jgi:hypothetical protein